MRPAESRRSQPPSSVFASTARAGWAACAGGWTVRNNLAAGGTGEAGEADRGEATGLRLSGRTVDVTRAQSAASSGSSRRGIAHTTSFGTIFFQCGDTCERTPGQQQHGPGLGAHPAGDTTGKIGRAHV